MRRVLGGLFVAVCVLGALEAVLLLVGFEVPPPPSEIPAAFADGRIEGRLVLRLDPELLWAPIPRATLPWNGERLTVDGFRSAPVVRERAAVDENAARDDRRGIDERSSPTERAGERAPITRRLAILGDGSAFGAGVRASECAIEVAASALSNDGTPCDALNAAVPGHTLLQGLERYTRDVRPWKPDLVVASFGAWEEHEPALRADAELLAHATPTEARAFRERVRRELKLAHLFAGLFGGSSGVAAPAQPAVGAFVDPAGAKTWEGTRRVSLDEFRAGLRELARRVREDDAKLVFVAPQRQPRVARASPVLGEYTRATLELARELAIPVIDVKELLAKLVDEGATYQDMFVGPIEPTARLHARIGEEIANVARAELHR